MKAVALRRGLRWAIGLCILFASLALFGSIQSLGGLLRLDEARESLEQTNAEDFNQALAMTFVRAYTAAQNERRELRIAIEFLLCGACGITFAAGARLLRPYGLTREPMRRLLTRSAVAAALLRTLEGAQDAGAGHYAATQIAAHFATLPGYSHLLDSVPRTDKAETAELLSQFVNSLPDFFVGAAAVWTAVIAGLFLFFARYFAKDTVKAEIEALDRALQQRD